MEQNKTGKYLKYAIGEIVLVVIGILIALSINNWNEERKTQILKINIYEELYISLRTDSIQLVKIIDYLNTSLKAQKLFINNTHNQIITQYHPEELMEEVYGGVMSFFPKYGVYQQLTSNNHLNLLSSSEINSSLIELFDFKYRRYENIDKILDDKFQYSYLNIMSGKMEQLVDGDKKVISSLNSIKFERHYDELLESIRTLYDTTEGAYNTLIGIQIDVNYLLALILEEI